VIVLGSRNPLEVALGNLGLLAEDGFKYASIRSSLAAYSLLTTQTTNAELQWTSSPVISRVAAILSPMITTSYSASLFVAEKPSVNDCSMMEPSEYGENKPDVCPLVV